MASQLQFLRLPEPGKVYRVVQWATGRIGACSLKALLQSRQFQVVGVYVHSESKEGRDAGELCGLAPVGVRATRNIGQLIALKPDCVVSSMEGPNVDDVCCFLENGINIATSRVDYLERDRMDPAVRHRVEDACRRGNATIHATGCSPGFSSEALPLVAVSMSRQVDCLTVDEFADIPASCPDFQTLAMGFGRPAGKSVDPHLLHELSHGFVQSLNVIAKGLGMVLDGIEVNGESAQTLERVVLPGGTPLEPGTVGAQRFVVAGMRGGRPVIRYRINWYAARKIDQDWKLRENGWRLTIEGTTPIEINVTFPVSGAALSPAMAGITAYRVINAVPYVCAAEPGIRSTHELPNIVPYLG